MSLLPNYEFAVIEDDKLTKYALNPGSERGQHKARVFESALGFRLENWRQLKKAILGALPQHEAEYRSKTPFGKKHEVLMAITGPNGRTVDVMTVWQYDHLPDGTFANAPRLVTLYIP